MLITVIFLKELGSSQPKGSEAETREEAKIYRKEQLNFYQEQINKAAGDICLKNPGLLRQRGKLLEMCRKYIDEGGYQYKKRSRSKYFGTESSGEHTSKRPKYDKDMRVERMREIEEELKTLNQHINIKQKRVDQKVTERKFDVCDLITLEIEELQRKRRELESERRILQKKEKKAKWYQRKKQVSPPFSDSEHNVESPRRGLGGGVSSSDTEGEFFVKAWAWYNCFSLSSWP